MSANEELVKDFEELPKTEPESERRLRLQIYELQQQVIERKHEIECLKGRQSTFGEGRTFSGCSDIKYPCSDIALGAYMSDVIVDIVTAVYR